MTKFLTCICILLTYLYNLYNNGKISLSPSLSLHVLNFELYFGHYPNE